MPVSQLCDVNTSFQVFSLSTDQSAWQKIPHIGIKFKRLATHEGVIWALGEDLQVYVYVYRSTVPIRVCEESYENQRFYPGQDFTSNLLPTDRTNFSCADGLTDRTLDSIHLPTLAWEWEGPWQLHYTFQGQALDKEAWTYSLDFPRSYTAYKTWYSYVRRRNWVRYRRYIALDTWSAVPPIHQDHTKEPFIDISVGGGEVPGEDADKLMVWGVTVRNRIMVREGVCRICPEGTAWTHVPTPADQDVISISVGRSGRVWAVTWDGVALVRTGISRDNPTGTEWIVVESPPYTCLQHIAVGVNVIWALTSDHKVWFRQEFINDQGSPSKFDINKLEQTEDVQSSDDPATSWVLMDGALNMIAVGPNDQIWGVEAEIHIAVIRTGVTPQNLAGQTWEPIALSLASELSHDPSPTPSSEPCSGPSPGLDSSKKQSRSALSNTNSYNSSVGTCESSSPDLIQEADVESLVAALSILKENSLQINLQMDHLKECCVCCEVYNESNHRPLILPCEHTMCKQCIKNVTSELQNTEVQCPICKSKHTVNKNQLPTNYAVFYLLRTTGNSVQPNESFISNSIKYYKDQDSKSEENNNNYEIKQEETETNSTKSAGMSNKTKKILTGVGIGVGAVAAGAAAVLAAPVVLTGIGFTSAGVAAGSWAASMMSAAAVANGGGVAAGSLVALLQSAGAVGLSATAAAGVGAAGATVGVAAGAGIAAGINQFPEGNTDNTNTVTKHCLAKESEFVKLFVYNVPMKYTLDDIYNKLLTMNINALDLSEISHSEARSKSFVVTIHKSECNAIVMSFFINHVPNSKC